MVSSELSANRTLVYKLFQLSTYPRPPNTLSCSDTAFDDALVTGM